MYTDNFEEEILFTPARKDGEACNHLKIVTAFTDVERISSHLIKLFDGRNRTTRRRRHGIIPGIAYGQ